MQAGEKQMLHSMETEDDLIQVTGDTPSTVPSFQLGLTMNPVAFPRVEKDNRRTPVVLTTTTDTQPEQLTALS